MLGLRASGHATVFALAALIACSPNGDGSPSPPSTEPASIRVSSGNGQSASISSRLIQDPTVEVLDAANRPVPGVSVTFAVVGGGGWVDAQTDMTDQLGRASAVWYLGPKAAAPQHLEARLGPLTTQFTATAAHPAIGQRTFGPDSFIEWIAGDLPIVVSAPHGGALTPASIPDRTVGTTTRDLNTAELAVEVSNAFHQHFGKRPHIVIARLHRRKLDPNREIVEAAAGNAIAERAWQEYHGFLEGAIAESRRVPGIGFYIDLHGHGHAIQRIELGYLVSSTILSLTDALLDAHPVASESSVRPFVLLSGRSVSSVLRGPLSLGAWLERGGFPTVPSPTNPDPGGEPYFDGGYSTQRHGTSHDDLFAGVQAELNFDGVRDTPENRQAFAAALVAAVDGFLRDHHVTLARIAPR